MWFSISLLLYFSEHLKSQSEGKVWNLARPHNGRYWALFGVDGAAISRRRSLRGRGNFGSNMEMPARNVNKICLSLNWGKSRLSVLK